MSVTFETFTDDDRRDALQIALDARRKRADVKERVDKGEISLFDVMDMDDPVIRKMRVRDLIMSVRGIGEKKCKVIMRKANISDNRCVGGVGIWQRKSLEEIFENRDWKE